MWLCLIGKQVVKLPPSSLASSKNDWPASKTSVAFGSGAHVLRRLDVLMATKNRYDIQGRVYGGVTWIVPLALAAVLTILILGVGSTAVPRLRNFDRLDCDDPALWRNGCPADSYYRPRN
jgi:hypothetical protein